MGAACDALRTPAPPSESVGATPPVPAPEPPAKTKARAKRVAKTDAAADAQRLDQLRRGLRRLVVAEETYYAENGVYTEDLGRIGFKPEAETQVQLLWVARAGWAASGTHPEMPGRSCVIYVGRSRAAPTTLRNGRSGREGVPVCDPAPAAPAASATASSESPAPAAAADTGSALDALNPSIQMRVDLRNLVRSQESYYGQQGVYSRRTEPFALQYLWHKGVTLAILSANDASWMARATHVSLPGKSCVIWVGPVTQKPITEEKRLTPDQPASPTCDE
jgi:hypothetical protein